MVNGCLNEKIRVSAESTNQFYKKFLEAREENLNVKIWTVTLCHTSHIRQYLKKGL